MKGQDKAGVRGLGWSGSVLIWPPPQLVTFYFLFHELEVRIQLTLGSGSGLGVIQGQWPPLLGVTQGQWPPLLVVLFEAPSHPVAQASLTLSSVGMIRTLTPSLAH